MGGVNHDIKNITAITIASKNYHCGPRRTRCCYQICAGERSSRSARRGWPNACEKPRCGYPESRPCEEMPFLKIRLIKKNFLRDKFIYFLVLPRFSKTSVSPPSCVLFILQKSESIFLLKRKYLLRSPLRAWPLFPASWSRERHGFRVRPLRHLKPNKKIIKKMKNMS